MSASASHPGLLLVLSGPSGVGKTTIVQALRARLPNSVFSVSATTRERTAQEEDGADYHFVSPERFRAMVEAGEFLEHAEYAGNCYGTPRRPVDEAIASGRTMILDIDVQGGKQVRERRPGALAVFILPPNDQALLERLRTRARDDEAAIRRRFARARAEIEEARSSGAYDAFVVNDDLERAVREVMAIVERRRSGA